MTDGTNKKDNKDNKDNKNSKIRYLDDGARVEEKGKPEPAAISFLQYVLQNMPKIIEDQAGEAMFRKIKYDSLVKVGFTKLEALELCK